MALPLLNPPAIDDPGGGPALAPPPPPGFTEIPPPPPGFTIIPPPPPGFTLVESGANAELGRPSPARRNGASTLRDGRPGGTIRSPSIPTEKPVVRPEFVFDENDPDVQAAVAGLAEFVNRPEPGVAAATGRVIQRTANRFAGVLPRPIAQVLKFVGDQLGLSNEFLNAVAKDLDPFIGPSTSALETGASFVGELGGTIAGLVTPGSIPGKLAKAGHKLATRTLVRKAAPRVAREAAGVAGGIAGFAAGLEAPRALAEGEGLLGAAGRTLAAPKEFAGQIAVGPLVAAEIIRNGKDMDPQQLREQLSRLEPLFLAGFILTASATAGRRARGFTREPGRDLTKGLAPPDRATALKMKPEAFFREFVAQGESETMRGHLKARVAAEKKAGETGTLDVFNRGAQEVIRGAPVEPEIKAQTKRAVTRLPAPPEPVKGVEREKALLPEGPGEIRPDKVRLPEKLPERAEGVGPPDRPLPPKAKPTTVAETPAPPGPPAPEPPGQLAELPTPPPAEPEVQVLRPRQRPEGEKLPTPPTEPTPAPQLPKPAAKLPEAPAKKLLAQQAVFNKMRDVEIGGQSLQEAAAPLIQERSKLSKEAQNLAERAKGISLPASAVRLSKARGVPALNKRIDKLDKAVQDLEDKFKAEAVKRLAQEPAKLPKPPAAKPKKAAGKVTLPTPRAKPTTAQGVENPEAAARKVIEDIDDPVARSISRFLSEDTGTVDVGAVKETVNEVRASAQSPMGKQAAGELRFFARRVFEETVNVVRKTGPFGNRLAEKIERAWLGSRLDSTEAMVRIEDAFHRAGIRGVRGRKANLEFGKKVEKGEKLTEGEQEIFDAWLAEHTRAAEHFNAVGGRVLDPETGPRPLQVGWRKFWPQQLKQNIAADLASGRGRTHQKAAEHLVKSKQAGSLEEAGVILKELFDPHFNGYFAGLERPRKILWPEEWREWRADRVMESYLKSAWRRIHEIREFGQQRRGSTFRSLLAGMRLEVPFRERAKHDDIAKLLYDRAFSLRPSAESLFSYIEGNFTTLTKVGNILNGVLQLSTFKNTVELVGMRRAIKSVYDVAVKGDVRRMIRLTGIAQRDFLRNVADFDRQGVLSTITRIPLKLQGTIFVDSMMRTFNAQAILLYAQDGIWSMGNHPKGRAARSARRTFNRLNISDKRIDEWVARQGLLDRDILDLMNRADAFAQFQNDPLRRPTWAHSDLGRMMLRLKNFAFQQSRFLWKNVLGEAAHGNLWPLLYAFGGATLFGEFYIQVKNWFLGRDRREKPILEIIEDADWRSALVRLGNDITAAGTFGLISDALRINETGALVGPTRMLVPPVVSTMDNVLRSLWAVMRPSTKDLNKTAGRRFVEQSKKLAEREIVGYGRAMGFLRSRGLAKSEPPFWNRKTPFSRDTAWVFDTYNRLDREIDRAKARGDSVSPRVRTQFAYLKPLRSLLIKAGRVSNDASVARIGTNIRSGYNRRFGQIAKRSLPIREAG